MKKIAALVLSLILLCGIFIMPASAATNYCTDFQSAINMLRWRIENNEVAEGSSFPTDAILDYTLSKFNVDDYATEKNPEGYAIKIEIPATVFEGKANELFANLNITALRAAQIYDGYDTENNQVLYRQCYDAAKQAYVFDGAGGMGDSTTYRVFGYAGSGKYTVYSAYIDLAEELTSAPTGAEGKEYIKTDGKYYVVYHWLKTVVEKGSEVKFHSWQKISASAVPTSGLVKPGDKTEDTSSVTSSAVSSTTSSAVSSEASSQTESESNITSSEATSNAPVTNITQIIYVNVENVTVESVTNVFPEGTVVNVVVVTDEAELEVVKTALKELTQKFVAYDITATSDNVAVQPDGTVKATFAIPEGYDYDKVGVIYVSDDGKTETIPCVVNKETGKVVAQLSHFSTYAVVELNEAAVDITIEKADTPAYIWVIIFVAIILALGGAAAAWYFLYFKKKGANTAE